MEGDSVKTVRSSRLDRLFVLLETGSSSVTRSAAAKQLGEVQRLHPHELNTLLTRTATYLRSGSWETRLAAGEAVRAIVAQLPPWQPKAVPAEEAAKYADACNLSAIGRLRFDQFDIGVVLEKGKALMASEGTEFDLSAADLAATRSVEQQKALLARQRQELNDRLGLQEAMMLVSNDDLLTLLSDEDAVGVQERQPLRDLIASEKRYNRQLQPQQQAPPLPTLPTQTQQELSTREMNRAKRKARQANEPDKKKSKSDEVFTKEEPCAIEEPATPPSPAENVIATWPVEWFCDQLAHDLFSPNWEHRHGAATALREIITLHGRGVGKTSGQTRDQMIAANRAWLHDMAMRLLCVLALDRFGDYVSDSVVAPVRETCAQTLCAVLRLLDADGCQKALNILIQLMEEMEWESRHGGLLGIKYYLAVHRDIAEEVFCATLPYIVDRLTDTSDDVAAVAAAALIPIAPLIERYTPKTIGAIVDRLWELLCDQDELASACNSFMGLLATLLSLTDVQQHLIPQPLAHVMPRLWPFFSHSASSVRRAALQTLGTLTEGRELEWSSPILQQALRHVYQRVLVEHLSDVRAVAENVWYLLLKHSSLSERLNAACPYVRVWFDLAMVSVRLPLDPSALVIIKPKRFCYDAAISTPKYYLGGSETTPLATREANAVQVRCMLARMLGELSLSIVIELPDYTYPAGQTPVDLYVGLLLGYMRSRSAVQRMFVGLVVAEWAARDQQFVCPTALNAILHSCLTMTGYYDELSSSCTRLAQDTHDFLASVKHHNLPTGVTDHEVLTIDVVKRVTGSDMQAVLAGAKLKKAKHGETLEERRKSLFAAAQQAADEHTKLTVTTHAAIAAAIVRGRNLPSRMTPVIKPLMHSIRRETNEELQRISATHLAILLDIRPADANGKIVDHLCTFLLCDPDFTPVLNKSYSGMPQCEVSPSYMDSYMYHGIVTLHNLQKHAEKTVFRRSNSTGRGPGRPPNAQLAIENPGLTKDEEEDRIALRIQRRGATLALTAITRHFGVRLQARLPRLWQKIVLELEAAVDVDETFDADQNVYVHDAAANLIALLQVLEVTTPHIVEALREQLFDKSLVRLAILLQHPYRAIRHMASRCLAALALVDAVATMEVIVERVLPLLSTDNAIERQGAVEAVACLVDTLQFAIVPYVVLLVVPLLGRMSDQNQHVRLMGTHCFATLVQLMPLDGAAPESQALQSSKLQTRRIKERLFLQQLLSPSKIPDYQLPVTINAQLRAYQQAGVNWLAFLNRFKLHGILCDDMGLGKTLQSICILATDHHLRAMRYEKEKSPDSAPLPSLVVCPPTLTGHWVYEVEKFLPTKVLVPVQYHGSPPERERIRAKIRMYNLIVASYDIVRKDLSFFARVKWNYVVLDEGHVIKNGKTRTSIAVKQLTANYRLILSGTPIQNNVLEIWSLFDFLMPGFLGTEKQFTARYSKPILASRDPKCSQKEQEAGALAMEALHRQVLPFLLRRMKEDVLADLPPKITQDYYCDLSPVQVLLYEDFSKSHAHQTLQASFSNGATASSMAGHTHIFQALRYLQNVCNHPKLVLNRTHPLYQTIVDRLAGDGTSLESIDHSAKLPALRQLLWDCGIGEAHDQADDEIVINAHRALVFCQLKTMLDIIEQDLFKKTMPEVTYLRLDGSVPPVNRHAIVARFNNDPSIDVLLLTTQVGGLGLNLTGADTVIFVEHDWNPMKDLQAMDRAHRIGQRKVVNVYRLITRGTLEEKIMGLQKFKVHTANTVISGENSRMETMDTDQLLDLFSHKPGASSKEGAGGSDATRGMRNLLDELPELWDDKQYEDEYDLSQFIAKLKADPPMHVTDDPSPPPPPAP